MTVADFQIVLLLTFIHASSRPFKRAVSQSTVRVTGTTGRRPPLRVPNPPRSTQIQFVLQFFHHRLPPLSILRTRQRTLKVLDLHPACIVSSHPTLHHQREFQRASGTNPSRHVPEEMFLHWATKISPTTPQQKNSQQGTNAHTDAKTVLHLEGHLLHVALYKTPRFIA